MEPADLIPAEDFCMHHQVEISFVHSLGAAGLIDVSVVEERVFIPFSQMPMLERMTRLHQMDINLEGIEAIQHLLLQMEAMRTEMTELRNRLQGFEQE